MSGGGLLGWAFGAGVLAAVNPCGFAVLPGYVAHFLGAQNVGRRRGASTIHGLFVGLCVAGGKLTVFAAIGAVFLAGGRAVVRVAPWAGVAVGLTLVGVGIWVLAGKPLRIPVPAGRSPDRAGYRSAYVFGLGYGACSLACCLPIFLGVFLGLGAGLVGTFGGSIVLFAAYAAGVLAVLVPLFMVTGTARTRLVSRLRRLSRFTEPVSGALLTASGLLLVLTWLPAVFGQRRIGPLTSLVLGWQRWAQNIVLRFGLPFWALLAGLVVWFIAVSIVRGRRRHDDRAELDSTPTTPEPTSSPSPVQ